jgi:hypothetical protein
LFGTITIVVPMGLSRRFWRRFSPTFRCQFSQEAAIVFEMDRLILVVERKKVAAHNCFAEL